VALVTPAFVMRRSDTKTVVGVAHGLHAVVLGRSACVARMLRTCYQWADEAAILARCRSHVARCKRAMPAVGFRATC